VIVLHLVILIGALAAPDSEALTGMAIKQMRHELQKFWYWSVPRYPRWRDLTNRKTYDQPLIAATGRYDSLYDCDVALQTRSGFARAASVLGCVHGDQRDLSPVAHEATRPTTHPCCSSGTTLNGAWAAATSRKHQVSHSSRSRICLFFTCTC